MNDPVIEYSKALLTETREELVRADNKASILLAASGVALGALLAAILGGDWTPFQLDVRIQWLWWVGSASAAVAVYWLGSAVYPRIRAKGPRPEVVAYYGDVVDARDRERVAELIEASSINPKDRFLDQIIQISNTVQTKYLAIRKAMWYLSLAAAFGLVSLMLNVAITA
ncbi:Pycsar system effector family protein [Arthrobacter sp. C152]